MILTFDMDHGEQSVIEFVGRYIVIPIVCNLICEKGVEGSL